HRALSEHKTLSVSWSHYPDGLNEPVTILAEDVSVRLIGIKFFADSKMDEFIKDLGEKLNDGNPLEGSSLSLF
ncbi:hypothetical protein, partial [Escherichia coli]|uniref:hypothetical protein n=1 Tax=Escherichia coli TaxID=562 RepID=UPI0011E9A923